MIKTQTFSPEFVSVLSRYPNCTSSVPTSTIVEFETNPDELQILDWFNNTYQSLCTVTEFTELQDNSNKHFLRIVGELK